jgi:hypothetical protein
MEGGRLRGRGEAAGTAEVLQGLEVATGPDLQLGVHDIVNLAERAGVEQGEANDLELFPEVLPA